MFDFLKSKVAVFLLAIIAMLIVFLALAGLYIHIQNGEIDDQRDQINGLKLERDALKLSIENQNKAIDDLKDSDQKKTKKAREAMLEAKAAADNHAKVARQVDQYQLTGDDCKDADGLVNAYLKVAIQ